MTKFWGYEMDRYLYLFEVNDRYNELLNQACSHPYVNDVYYPFEATDEADARNQIADKIMSSATDRANRIRSGI